MKTVASSVIFAAFFALRLTRSSRSYRRIFRMPILPRMCELSCSGRRRPTMRKTRLWANQAVRDAPSVWGASAGPDSTNVALGEQ